MRKIKFIGFAVAIAIAAAVVASACTPAEQLTKWDGSVATETEMQSVYDEQTATYTIGKPSQLAWLSQQVNEEYRSFAGVTFALSDDLDLNGMDFRPIGNVNAYPSRAFAGTFDGKGHTIFHLKATDDNDANGEATAALFGSINGATIQNLTLSKATVSGDHYTGALVGYASAGNNAILRCTVADSNIKAVPVLVDGSYDNGDKVGGLIGYGVGVNISECRVRKTTVTGYRDVGGLIGYGGVNTVISDNEVKDCTVVQDDANDYGKTEEEKYVGAVIGRNGGAMVEDNETASVAVERVDRK